MKRNKSFWYPRFNQGEKKSSVVLSLLKKGGEKGRTTAYDQLFLDARKWKFPRDLASYFVPRYLFSLLSLSYQVQFAVGNWNVNSVPSWQLDL